MFGATFIAASGRPTRCSIFLQSSVDCEIIEHLAFADLPRQTDGQVLGQLGSDRASNCAPLKVLGSRLSPTSLDYHVAYLDVEDSAAVFHRLDGVEDDV